MPKPRLTFRKDKNRRWSAASYTASLDGQAVARIQEAGRTSGQWFTYGTAPNGDRFNTAATPDTLENIKAALKARFTTPETPK